MNIKDILKNMIHAFFIITTGVIISMYTFCSILIPDASYTLEDIRRILIMAFASDLPFLIFYSPKEYGKTQMQLRMILHFFIVLGILLFLSHRWDWVNVGDTKETLVFILLVLFVYLGVSAYTTYRDKKLAEKISEKLQERYRS